jgi:ribonuclease Z
MFVVFLGTGSALPSVDRANTSLALVAAAGAGITLIDCGGDPFRQMLRAGHDPRRVTDIMITHAHIDHIGGLPSLIESFRIIGRTAPLHVHAIAHPLQAARDLLRAYAFELTLHHWPFAVELHELQSGTPVSIGDFAVTPIAADHTVPSAGLRAVPAATPNGPLFAYTCDTRVAPMIPDIARNADLFVAEATYPHGQDAAAAQVGHMTTSQAGEMARAGAARALALVHLSAGYAQEGQVKREARLTYRGPLIIPRDLNIVRIERRARLIRRIG